VRKKKKKERKKKSQDENKWSALLHGVTINSRQQVDREVNAVAVISAMQHEGCNDH